MFNRKRIKTLERELLTLKMDIRDYARPKVQIGPKLSDRVQDLKEDRWRDRGAIFAICDHLFVGINVSFMKWNKKQVMEVRNFDCEKNGLYLCGRIEDIHVRVKIDDCQICK